MNSAFNGTIRQAVRVAGKIGKALSFDGVDDWVTVTDVTASPLDLCHGHDARGVGESDGHVRLGNGR